MDYRKNGRMDGDVCRLGVLSQDNMGKYHFFARMSGPRLGAKLLGHPGLTGESSEDVSVTPEVFEWCLVGCFGQDMRGCFGWEAFVTSWQRQPGLYPDLGLGDF